ncbi:MAG: crossover junction endodeoxyribonuclease RuvC [Candidatus Omnitrophota bacterium]
MRILGIDPALHITGYGLIDQDINKIKLIEAGFIKTSPKDFLGQRLNRIHIALTKLINDNLPKAIVLEKLYAHVKHPTTAFILGHARGVICLTADISGIPVIELGATRVKKAITGFGNASKLQVKRAIQYFLDLKDADWPEDVSDALALAVTYANIQKHNIKFS